MALWKHGHFWHRQYYFWDGGWFWWDDLIPDWDPLIPTLADVPVCGDDDTDDCDVQPIASVMPVRAQAVAVPVPAGGCEVVVFWENNFGGESWRTSDDQTFVTDHWNDHIYSIQVKAGTWEFYQDPDYGGDMLKLVVGQYPKLDDNWTGQISSMRCVR